MEPRRSRSPEESFPRHETQISHELAGPRKAAPIDQLAGEDHGAVHLESSEAIPELVELDFAVTAALMSWLRRWVRANHRALLFVDQPELIEEVKTVWGYMQEPFVAWGARTDTRFSGS
jgi:hypothetical protein